MIIDFDSLKVSRPALFRSAVAQLGYGRGEKTFDPFVLVLGTRKIQDHELDPELRRLLKFWIDKTVSPPVAEEPAASAPPQKPVEPLLSEEELAQRAADQVKGLARLQQFSDEQSLEESPQNVSLVDVWLTQRGLFWSQDNVDKAVLSLKNVLTWKPKTVEPPPAPEEQPAEVLGTLSDGTMQLPLNVDNATLRRASKDQAFDWLKRTNAGKLIRPRGSFSSTLPE